MSAVPSVADVAPHGSSHRAAPLPRGRRSAELVMLCFAVGIMAFAFAAAGLGLNGHVPSGLVVYVAGFAALMALAHLAARRFAPWADPLMLPLAALLNGLGIVMIYRLQESGTNGNPGLPISTLTTHAALYQLMWTAVGIVAFIVVLAVIREPRVLQRYTYTLGTLGLFLLAIPALLPASHSSVNGAKVWIILGGFSIQPGEFARIALAVFFAGYLVRKRDVLSLAGRRFLGIDLPRGRDMGPILVLWGIAMLILIFESDIGIAALFFGMFVAMLYISTQRKSWLLIGILLFVAGALLAAGVVQSDFIFTGLGEELGLTGLMALLLIFGLLVQRGLRAALAVRDPFAKLLAAGVAFVLALQVFIIVGGVTQIIPLTGITTPFLSQGGSSLVASWIVIALLMRISDTARRPAPQSIQDEGLTQVVRAI